MLAFIYSFILILAEGGTPWWNYPGFEAWKFFNLAIFAFIIYMLLRKPLSSAFKAKREAIRAELIKAEEERQAALAQLTSAEARLARLESESQEVIEKARLEAEAEKARIAAEAADEAERLRRQTESEIARKNQQVRADLRRFSAEESIRLAEARLKSQINAQNDAQLVKAGIEAIGGLK